MADIERAQAEGESAGTTTKRREEVDAILQRIAEHIAEVDRRQVAITQASPAGAAGPDAGDAASSATGAGSSPPTIGSGSHDAMPAPTTAPPAAAVSDDTLRAGAEPDGAQKHSGLPPFPTLSLRLRPNAVEPPVLRSAVRTEAAPAAPRRMALRETSPGVAPPATTPAAGSPAAGTPDADETAADLWDSQTAETLTRAFEVDAVVPPLRSTLEAMALPPGGPSATSGQRTREPHPPAADLQGATSPHSGEPTPTPLPGASLLHGETQLAEMSRRIEAALDRLAPREMVEALDRQFDGLRRQVAGSEARLARLDGIEDRLGELSAKLSDSQVVSLFGGLVPTAEDLGQFAEDAASRAADRALEAYVRQMPAGAAATRDDGTIQEIAALRELVGSFISECRRSDASTQEALETLQLAMQHVLDRIDPPEPASTSAPAAIDPPTPRSADPEQHRREAALMQVHADLAREISHFHYDPDADRLDAHLPQDLDADLDAPFYAEPLHSPHDAEPSAPANGRGLHLPPHAAAPADAAHAMADDPSGPLPGNDRQAFIAMARKAAEKAKAEADVKAAAEPPAGRSRNLRTQIIASKPAATLGGVRPGVLVVTSLAAFLLAAYWLLSGSKAGLPGFQPAAVHQEAPVAPTRAVPPPPSGAQPDMDPEDARRNGSSSDGPSPARPNRTSGEVGTDSAPLVEASADDRQIEMGALGIAVTQSEGPPTIDAVMRARNQQHLANLSQRAAFTAARQHAATATSAASLLEPSDTAGPISQPATSDAPAAGRTHADAPTQLELPPASLGPLSLRVAAAKGDASAQLEIATRYAEGRGVKQSFSEAVVWYQRAAMQGVAVAQYRLATLYERGMGLKADPARARVWYQRAAEQGNLKAMHNLAVMSASPANGTPDYDTAARLFADAAGQGLTDSQYNLAILAESGLGMQKDLVAAYTWYTLAAKAGDQDAARRRDLLIPGLSRDMIQAGEKQVAAWRAKPGNELANDARMAAQAWKQRSASARP